MVYYCCVSGCHNCSRKGFALFQVPEGSGIHNEYKRKRWLNNLGISQTDRRLHLRVCEWSRHREKVIVKRPPEISPSETFKKHLRYPQPLEKKTRQKSSKLPSAISSAKWREYYRKTEEIKTKKEDEIKKRRDQRKMTKENKAAEKALKAKKVQKRKNNRDKAKLSLSPVVSANKEKVRCGACQEVLVSDTEDEEEMNIGCDKCPMWYHMKCTEFQGIPYEEATAKDYVCYRCT